MCVSSTRVRAVLSPNNDHGLLFFTFINRTFRYSTFGSARISIAVVVARSDVRDNRLRFEEAYFFRNMCQRMYADVCIVLTRECLLRLSNSSEEY